LAHKDSEPDDVDDDEERDAKEKQSHGKSPNDIWAQQPQATRGSRSKMQCVRNLVQLLPRLLDIGDLDKARQVFALLVRFYGANGLLGIHKNGLWAIGVELLAHEGLPASRVTGSTARVEGKATDLLEELIRRYPWQRKNHRSFMSALHFWYVLFASQVYAVHAAFLESELDVDEQRRRRNEEEDPVDPDGPDDGRELRDSDTEAFDRQEAEARELALSQLNHISAKMDKVLQDQPYATDEPLRALREGVASMLEDLTVENAGADRDGWRRPPQPGFSRRLSPSDGERSDEDGASVGSGGW
jgi:hypothetical protein